MGGLSLLLMAGEQSNRDATEKRRHKSEPGILSDCRSFLAGTSSDDSKDSIELKLASMSEYGSKYGIDGGLHDTQIHSVTTRETTPERNCNPAEKVEIPDMDVKIKPEQTLKTFSTWNQDKIKVCHSD